MLRAATVVLRATAGAAGSSAVSAPPPPSSSPPPPPRVLVLTMVPNGGAVADALRLLGYNPYTLENAVRKGRVLTHPQEWMAVLRREKPFDFDLLKVPEVPEDKKRGNTAVNASNPDASNAAVAAPPRYFDSLAGPPATIAFEAILKACPRSTRVILVEEPDKLSWEKDMDQWLRPLVQRCERSTMWWQDSRLHTMLLDMVDLRRALIDPADAKRGRRGRWPRPTSSAAMTAQNVPLAQQQKALRLAGALDLFEQHVKEVVPADRLLVYHVQDGWRPLCEFLQRPIPTASPSASAAAAASSASAVASPNEPLPFPTNSNGSSVLVALDQSLQKATAIVICLVLSLSALGLLLLGSFREEFAHFYRDYRDHVRRDFDSYIEEEQARAVAGGKDAREAVITARQALLFTKKASKRFGEEYEAEGGAAASMSGVLRRFTGVAPSPPATASPSETAELREEK